MTIEGIIIAAAKAAHVSAALLTAICSHESNNFTMTYAANDHGSPSYGVCQVKEFSARQVGFTGDTEDLMDPRINARYAAKYLRYQHLKYGEENWCAATSAYNSGSYRENSMDPGYPKNLRYVRLVQKRLPENFRDRLNCGGRN